ncbi:MAG: hypothetical protein NTW78_06030 [Campylobacterales bacterium]|nr:hypothetical protein [Campylobacterales bacterium]
MLNGKLTKNSLSLTLNGKTYTREYYCSVRSTSGFADAAIPEWIAGNYAVNAEVKIDALKRIFKLHALAATVEHPLEHPELWTDMGGINSYKAFDNILNSQAVATQSVTIEINFNRSNALALLNIEGMASITVEQKSNIDNSVVVAATTYTTRKFAGKTPYSIFFKPIRTKRVLLIKGLKWHPNSRLIVTIPYAGKTLKIGTIANTMLLDLGATLYKTSIGFDNDSTRIVDDFGGVTFTEREVTDILKASVIIDTDDTDEIFYTLKSRAKEMSLWVGDNRDKGFESLTMIGYPQGTEFSIEKYNKAEYPITIIGDSNAN